MSSLIEALSRWRRSTPRAPALQDACGIVTWSELAARVRDLASRFSAGQCRCIAIHAENGSDWVVADLAALASGATVVPVPPFFSHLQVSHLLGTAPVDTLLVDEVRAAEVQRDFVHVPAPAGFMAMYRRAGGNGAERAQIAATAKITFTSGSTGEPKGVCLTRAGLERTAAGLATMLRDVRIRRHLCVLPLATLLENVAGIYAPLMLGATMHVPPLADIGLGGSSSIDGRVLRDAIDRTGAESVILLPQMLKELTEQVAASPWCGDGPLRFTAVGGGRVSDADLDAARAAGIPAFQGYGLSECHSVVALNRPGAARRGSVGRPLPEVRISVAPDGELLVGGNAMRGYLGEAPVAGDLVPTGDLGRVDEDGFVYVTGRKKNVFITSFGRNVSPEWPEAELLHDTAIAQVVVHGEGRPSNLAIIVPARHAIDGQALAAAVARANLRLPDYARIAEWLVAEEPFTPANGLLTASGKPRREAVLRRYVDGATGLANRDVHSLTTWISS